MLVACCLFVACLLAKFKARRGVVLYILLSTPCSQALCGPIIRVRDAREGYNLVQTCGGKGVNWVELCSKWAKKNLFGHLE